MHSISFTSHDHTFCEASLYIDSNNNPHPEYINTLSSLFLSFIGLRALTYSNLSSPYRFLYTSMMINGFTSAGYHWTNQIGWGLLDRMSMILIALSSTFVFMQYLDDLIEMYRWQNVDGMLRAINLLIAAYFTILYTVAGLHYEEIFNYLFSCFLISLVVFMILIHKYRVKLRIKYDIVKIGWKGIFYIVLSGFFWITSEKLCSSYPMIRYLHGHAIWHIAVSYGGYLVSLVPLYIHQKTYAPYVAVLLQYDGTPYLVPMLENQLLATQV